MECYTAGGDSYQNVWHPQLAGQTFVPTETFDLEWVDLQLQLPLYLPEPVVLIYYADAHHEPSGDYLARDRYIIFREPGWTGFHRYRFSMQPLRLLKGVKYCITVGYYPPAGVPAMRWQYDAGDAEYPRGFRISSDDGGDTWSKHYDDDHMFAIFGTPPSPPPPPDPPIEHFITPGISYQPTFDGLKITLVTNVPCHLWMYWTLIPPRKHRIPRLRRGVQFSDILQYCFVAWHKNEQSEPGDTVIHTFVKAPWPVCQTRYFIFRGNVDDQLSPSISAIFTKHRTPEEILTLYPAVEGSLSNRHVQQIDISWPACHDSPTGTIPDSYKDPWYTIFAGESLTVSYRLFRGMLFFDHTGLPVNAHIKYATLDIFCWEHLRTSSSAYPYLCITQGVQDDPVVPANYGGQLPYTLIGGQKDFGTFIDGEYNSITLNEDGLSFIKPGGWTKLCLRGQQDILDRPPPLGTNWVKFYSSQKGAGYRPRLTVWYWIP